MKKFIEWLTFKNNFIYAEQQGASGYNVTKEELMRRHGIKTVNTVKGEFYVVPKINAKKNSDGEYDQKDLTYLPVGHPRAEEILQKRLEDANKINDVKKSGDEIVDPESTSPFPQIDAPASQRKAYYAKKLGLSYKQLSDSNELNQKNIEDKIDTEIIKDAYKMGQKETKTLDGKIINIAKFRKSLVDGEGTPYAYKWKNPISQRYVMLAPQDNELDKTQKDRYGNPLFVPIEPSGKAPTSNTGNANKRLLPRKPINFPPLPSQEKENDEKILNTKTPSPAIPNVNVPPNLPSDKESSAPSNNQQSIEQRRMKKELSDEMKKFMDIENEQQKMNNFLRKLNTGFESGKDKNEVFFQNKEDLDYFAKKLGIQNNTFQDIENILIPKISEEAQLYIGKKSAILNKINQMKADYEKLTGNSIPNIPQPSTTQSSTTQPSTTQPQTNKGYDAQILKNAMNKWNNDQSLSPTELGNIIGFAKSKNINVNANDINSGRIDLSSLINAYKQEYPSNP